MTQRLICILCPTRVFLSLNAYLLHLRIRHANDARFRVVCGISLCKCEYDKYASFYKHIRRRHSEFFASSSSGPAAIETGLNCNELDHDMAICDDGSDNETYELESANIQELQEQMCAHLSVSMLKYSVKLREKFLLPASTHNSIMDDCKTLIVSILNNQSELTKIHLKNKGYQTSDDSELLNILDSRKYERIMDECSSSFKLIQNCTNKLGMIKPIMHQFGNFKGYHVPVKAVLQKLVMKYDIAHFVLQGEALHEHHMTSFTCGENYQSLRSLKTDGHLLQIHLYNDEFEVVNPIGAKRGKHKMNATYFTLGNLPSKYKSQLQHIYLTYIVKHKSVTSMGYAVAFAPLVVELQKLYDEGFSVTYTDGRVEKFYAILCTVSGDNLSSHALAGFRQVFNSGRICRMCMVSHGEIADKILEDDVTLRNATNHAYHVKAVCQNPDNAAIYGVSGPSIFSTLPYFDVMKAFPPDIMHDCMEGVIPKIVEAIVTRLVSKKIVTVAQFNDNVSSFQFKGTDSTNRPEPIRRDCSIIGSATQKMCLFKLLPFFVPLNKCKEALRLYSLAREVMMYAFSRSISKVDLDYFQQKIEGFLSYVVNNFPTVRITPKFHFLIHYPTMMARFGPLRNLWCMRYEAKHQYFKSVASSLGNFINIASTLANRHQMLQCYMFSSDEALNGELTLPNSGKLIPFTSLSTEIQKCLCFASSQIWSVNSATSSGCNYSVGAAIIIDFTECGDPVMLEITHLLVPHDGHLDIVGKLLMPVSFSNSLFAYEVTENGFAHCHPGTEKDCVLLWSYNACGSKYVTLPYRVPQWSSVLSYTH